MNFAEDIIRRLGLIRHPEGGYYREIYRSDEQIPAAALPERFKGSRCFSTCIVFLIAGEDFSAFHRLKSDEVWLFLDGAPLRIDTIEPDGTNRSFEMGRDLYAGQEPVAVLCAGWWFGAKCLSRDSYSLVSCVVAPGFDAGDFELGRRPDLVRLFPRHKKLIEGLTRMEDPP
jgi:uncharacterized protein